MKEYDFIVLGGGSAGYAAARTAAESGLKTAVVEGGREVAGLCILRGCMPSKTLIESANRYLTLRRAEEFGLHAKNIGFDGMAIIARKRKLIKEFADYRNEQLKSGKFDFFRAMAGFTDAHTITLRDLDEKEQTLSAKNFLIATGSSVSVPKIPGLPETGFLTSDDVLDSEHIPESVIVLGAGPVALELAHYYNALGVKVSIIQRGKNLLTGIDPEMAKVIEETFRKRGMQIFTNTNMIRAEKVGNRKQIVFAQEGIQHTVEAEEIFAALGRKPNIHSLNLDAAGVKTEKGRVTINPSQQTTTSHIFGAGDVCGPYEIVHIAIQQGEIAARNAARLLQGASEPLEQTDYRLKLYAVFTEPQLAVVGRDEKECADEGIPYLVASYPFHDHGKSMVMGETEGFVKLIAHADTGEILGGGVVGPHASDLIHEVVVAMAGRFSAREFAAIPHYHPTLSEIWTYPAEEIASRVPDPKS